MLHAKRAGHSRSVWKTCVWEMHLNAAAIYHKTVKVNEMSCWFQDAVSKCEIKRPMTHFALLWSNLRIVCSRRGRSLEPYTHTDSQERMMGCFMLSHEVTRLAWLLQKKINNINRTFHACTCYDAEKDSWVSGKHQWYQKWVRTESFFGVNFRLSDTG